MKILELFDRQASSTLDPSASSPLLLNPTSPVDQETLANIVENEGVISIHDTIEAQLADLVTTRNPSLKLEPPDIAELVAAQLDSSGPHEYGTWVYYPWSGRLVHVLPEPEFRELRADRNRYKITTEEQATLSRATIGIVGLSVGQATAVCMCMEGVGGHFRLADMDNLELSNMNRLRTGVHQLGTSKAVIAAQGMTEIDPYLDIEVFTDGITPDNMESFLAVPLDLLVEECDELAIKVRIRERARALGIPVLMDTSDRGLIDIERFDREPDRPLFHGIAGHLDADAMQDLTRSEKVSYVLKILGETSLSPRGAASIVEMEQTISTWPQLASGVTLGAAVSTDAARRILLGQLTQSGRWYVDLDVIVSDDSSEILTCENDIAVAPSPDALATSHLSPISTTSGLTPSLIRRFVEHGILAPSGGNSQPWRFIFSDGSLKCFIDPTRSSTVLDANGAAGALAVGAAVENIALAAAASGHETTVHTAFDPHDPERICDLVFTASPSSHPTPDLIQQIPERVSNRQQATRSALTRVEVDILAKAAGSADADIQVITNPASLEEIGAYLGEGDRLRFLNRTMHSEMMAEMRWNPRQVERTRDGLDVATLELSSADVAAMRVISSWRAMKTVEHIGGGGALTKPARKSVASASAMILITTQGTAPVCWFVGGRAMQRVWLTATSLGLTLQPMTAITYLFARLSSGNTEALSAKEISTLKTLRERHRAIFPNADGHAEVMLARIARADPPSARSLRRRIDDVLRIE